MKTISQSRPLVKGTSFHLDYSGPIEPHWPKGAWSVYAITGDQIAQRIKFGTDGKATERHSWCGFLGMNETLAGAMDLIRESSEK